MKKLLATAILAVCTAANAQHFHYHRPDVGIAVGIGILTGVLIANSQREVVREVIVQPPVAYPIPSHPPVYMPPSPIMYRAVDVFIPECNCVRTIMVPVR